MMNDILQGVVSAAIAGAVALAVKWMNREAARIKDENLRRLAEEAVEYVEGALGKLLGTGKGKFNEAVLRVQSLAPVGTKVNNIEGKVSVAFKEMAAFDAFRGLKTHGRFRDAAYQRAKEGDTGAADLP